MTHRLRFCEKPRATWLFVYILSIDHKGDRDPTSSICVAKLRQREDTQDASWTCRPGRWESTLGQIRSQTVSLPRSLQPRAVELQRRRVSLFFFFFFLFLFCLLDREDGASVQKAITLEAWQKDKRVRCASVNREWCQCQLFLSSLSTFFLHYWGSSTSDLTLGNHCSVCVFLCEERSWFFVFVFLWFPKGRFWSAVRPFLSFSQLVW